MGTLYSDLNKVKVGKQKNAIINGNFLVWQRGASFNPHTAGFTSDRWYYSRNSTGSFRIDREASILPHSNTIYSYKLTTITGQASFTGDNHSTLQQGIEGFDYVQFIGKTATLSFWVRSSVAGTYSCAFRSGVGDRSYIAEYTIHSANTWEYKTITLKFDYSGGTWDIQSGLGLRVSFSQGIGSTYATSTLGQWLSGNYLASSNQVNWAASNGNTFYLSDVQLELGSEATSFEQIPPGIQFLKCLRYYEVKYIYTNAASISASLGAYYNIITYNTKRAAPTVTSLGVELWGAAWYAATSVTVSVWDDRLYFNIRDTVNSGYTLSAALIRGTFYMDAEII